MYGKNIHTVYQCEATFHRAIRMLSNFGIPTARSLLNHT